jgi:hypothetical protein
MPELFSMTRAPSATPAFAGAASSAGSRPGLASSFGASTSIVPAGVTGTTTAPTAGLVTTPPRPGVRRTVAGSGAGGGSRTAAAVHSAALGGPPPPRAASAGRAPLRRSYVPAPPPISIRPAPMSGPAVPAAAQGVSTDATPALVRRSVEAALAAQAGSVDSSRSQLADSTAHLFRAARISEGPIRRFAGSPDTTGGTPVGPSVPIPTQRQSLVNVADMTTMATPDGPADTTPLSATDMDQIVDRVIDKIEQRVVDELERRGRRYTPGVF